MPPSINNPCRISCRYMAQVPRFRSAACRVAGAIAGTTLTTTTSCEHERRQPSGGPWHTPRSWARRGRLGRREALAPCCTKIARRVLEVGQCLVLFEDRRTGGDVGHLRSELLHQRFHGRLVGTLIP